MNWIKCNDKLPKERKTVWACREDDDLGNEYFSACLWSSKKGLWTSMQDHEMEAVHVDYWAEIIPPKIETNVPKPVYVKGHFGRKGHFGSESMWVQVESIVKNTIEGRLANQPIDTDLQHGDKVKLIYEERNGYYCWYHQITPPEE